LHDQLTRQDVIILGVNPEKEESHRRFRDRESLPFDLLVDSDLSLCRLYDVRVTNLLVLKLVQRVTYVIGKDGRIKAAIEGSSPAAHAAEALRSCGHGG